MEHVAHKMAWAFAHFIEWVWDDAPKAIYDECHNAETVAQVWGAESGPMIPEDEDNEAHVRWTFPDGSWIDIITGGGGHLGTSEGQTPVT